MADDTHREWEPLTRLSRSAGVFIAVLFLGSAVWITLFPPDRTVALSGCQSKGPDCLVTVDGDTTTLAAALLALAAVAGLIALLGVRPTSVKAAGIEVEFARNTAGLPTAEPQPDPDDQEGKGDSGVLEQTEYSPVRIDVVPRLGGELGIVPVAVASLDAPMNESQGRFLRDYQSARRTSQKGWFLTHILGPAKTQGQLYSVAIKVTPLPRRATGEVRAARFFFGRAWGYRVFEGLRGADGRFGITTEAYGPFLALCEVEFTSGERLLLDHYCDFEMGGLVAG